MIWSAGFSFAQRVEDRWTRLRVDMAADHRRADLAGHDPGRVPARDGGVARVSAARPRRRWTARQACCGRRPPVSRSRSARPRPPRLVSARRRLPAGVGGRRCPAAEQQHHRHHPGPAEENQRRHRHRTGRAGPATAVNVIATAAPSRNHAAERCKVMISITRALTGRAVCGAVRGPTRSMTARCPDAVRTLTRPNRNPADRGRLRRRRSRPRLCRPRSRAACAVVGSAGQR